MGAVGKVPTATEDYKYIQVTLVLPVTAVLFLFIFSRASEIPAYHSLLICKSSIILMIVLSSNIDRKRLLLINVCMISPGAEG